MSRYNGPGNDDDAPYAGVVSPDGGTVFVTGLSRGLDDTYDYATLAYSASTGQTLWLKRFDPSGDSDAIPYGIAMSPGGGRCS